MYKILLVEDELSIRSGLKSIVENVVDGFTVQWEAGSGKEALQVLQGQLPDVLVTDIRMKQMNGLELIERMRERSAELPILLISGYSDFEYAKEAIRNGVFGYLLKPVDRVELAQYFSRIKKRLDENTAHPRNLDLRKEESKPERQVIRKAKELVIQRLDQEISLQYIAEQVQLSTQYLSSLFKMETGQNFNDFVTESRMSKAKQLLITTNLKIYEIASLTGYANPKHFMMSFKQTVGMTPSEYRESVL